MPKTHVHINFITEKVVSTYNFHDAGCSTKHGINDLSNITTNIPAITGFKRDPITTPSGC